MLQSKKAPYDRLPVNPRRIQWFISQGMVPKPFGHKYEYLHLVYYWATIFARKRQRFTFQQIEGLAMRVHVNTAERFVFGAIQDLPHSELITHRDQGQNQKSMETTLVDVSREKERPLISKLIRVAITPWCHLHLNENHVTQLSPEAVDVLVNSFRGSLNELMVDRE